MKNYLINQLGAEDWKLIEQQWQKYEEKRINRKTFLKKGKRKLGQTFEDCFLD